MALVNYGNSDESDLSDLEDDESPKLTTQDVTKNVPISDEEDGPSLGVADEEDEPEIATSMFSLLKQPKSKSKETALIDENEDLSTIPTAKVYTQTPAEKPVDKKPSIWSSRVRKTRKQGPVKIMAPSLLPEEEEEEPRLPAKRPTPSDGPMTHSLFSMLPKPKNQHQQTASPGLSTKPMTTTTTSMMPRTVKKKKTATVMAPDSDSDDYSSTPFFSFEGTKVQPGPSTSSAVIRVGINAIPDAIAPQDRPLDGRTAKPRQSNIYGPSMAQSGDTAPTYDDPNDLMANRVQIERLQGRLKKRGQMQEELGNVVEVNASDLTADPREWMTKALTDDTDKPGPRCTLGGQTKRKHQITYLAALAKEKEQELKKTWSENAHARRAAGNKYGF